MLKGFWKNANVKVKIGQIELKCLSIKCNFKILLDLGVKTF